LALGTLNCGTIANQPFKTFEAEDMETGKDTRVTEALATLGTHMLCGTRLLEATQLLLFLFFKSLAILTIPLEQLLVLSHFLDGWLDWILTPSCWFSLPVLWQFPVG
jgi:hypothetical protein